MDTETPGNPRAIGLERMLRINFVQRWYGLADEAVEAAVYDSQALRTFMGLDLSRIHFSGGGGEIRTHERLPFAGFQDRCNRPLCHTSQTFSRVQILT